ncbi:MAG: hypothetical protein A2140_08115 [Candidatus Muproteobacteria bacterium RBG_16_62_13]|uniref:Teneurin-like YD-shell domain-containing protein n=1 Tax=Candidatus Muproteobacteria bacterium RBG_16_62_13 TaxID=1817756 RepID=A0A1F6T6Y9_9PROT|nr:MAG: hypothetical protein A2140_08115 [Candidatus Muproteobacteria bacterium RBG_16_62_13]
MQLRRPDGYGEPFTCPTSGACSGDSDTQMLLSKDTTGYTLTVRDNATERYDLNGRLVSEKDASGRTTSYAYDANGRLYTVTGPFGHKLTFSYNPGVWSTLTDPAGQVITYGYDVNKNLIRVTYPDTTAKLYHYENTSFPNHLTGISYVDASGTVTRLSTYAYDTTGKAILTQHAQTDNGSPQEKFTLNYNSATQTTVTDPVGTQEIMTFATSLGVKNLVSKLNQGDGKVFTQTFDGNNNLTCKKDEEGRVTTYTYNQTNQRLTQTEGQGGDCTAPVATAATRTTTYQYLSPTLALPTVIASPSVYPGQVKQTEIAYNNNLPATITQRGYTPQGNAVARTIRLQYNSHGQVASIDGTRTDAGDVTGITYNECTSGGGCGGPRSIANALGHTTSFDQYDAHGRLTEMTDPNGLKTSYAYDLRGRVLSVTQAAPDGAQRMTQYAYNAAGNVTQVIFPDTRTLNYTYDAAQYLRTVTDNLGNRVDYNYDLKGNRTQTYTYDPSSTLVRQIDTAYGIRNHITSINAAGSTTQQAYDAVGNLTLETDPKNNPATTHGYDALNRLMQTIDALSGATAVSYDVNDRVKQVTAPNNATTQYLYDDLGNLLQETGLDRGNISYSYDAAGNVMSQTDARGVTVSYAYDALNRLASVDYPGTAEDVSYTYDSGTNCTAGAGRLCQVVDASGATEYAYDAFGNVLTHTRTELEVTYTTQYSYDAADRITTVTYTDGRVVSYTRNSLGQITAVSTTQSGTTTTMAHGLTYRADGPLTGLTYGNGLTETRTHDLQGRLTQQSLGTDAWGYTYDANGNVTTTARPFGAGNFTYDALDRLTLETLQSSAQGFTYDANGNRKTDGLGTYDYLANSNRLTTTPSGSVTRDDAGNLITQGSRNFGYLASGQLRDVTDAGSLLAAYTYNSARQRTRKTAGGQTTVYHYDLAGNLLQETTATGAPVRTYAWLEDRPLAQIEPNRIVYLHTDHLHTPRSATDANQQVIWRWDADAFGAAPAAEDPDQDGLFMPVNLRFGGQYYDAETGLFYNWNRYYDPKIGRYISSDPIGLEGGLNSYTYVRNNPLRYTDPMGLFDPGPILEPITKVAPRILPGILGPIGSVIGGLWPSEMGSHPCESGPPGACAPTPPPTCHTKADCEEAFRIQWSICSKLQGEARRKCQQNATNLLAQCLQTATD